MARTFKTTVAIGDDAHEGIEVELPEGYLSPDEVQEDYVPKQSVENNTAAALRKDRKDQRDRLLSGEDEQFFDDFLTRHNLVKPEDAPPDLDKHLESARAEWESGTLKPVQDENALLKDQNRDLLTSKLISDVVAAAAAAGVKQPLLQPGPNGVPQIVNMLGSFFAWDSEHKYFAVKTGEDPEGRPTFKYSSKPQENRPHADVAEFMKGWAEDKANADFLADERMRGPGMDEPGEGGSKDVVLTPEQASDHATYMAAQKKAVEQGGRVRVES